MLQPAALPWRGLCCPSFSPNSGVRSDGPILVQWCAGPPRIVETPDGFIALQALPPIALSDESGEGEGPRLTIGDSEPDPDLLRVDDRFRHVELWVERCSDAAEELSPSGEYASLCLGGVLTVNINGDREFVRGVLDGLEAREVRLGSA